MKAKIHPSLAALVVPITSLHEDQDNARKHSARSIQVIQNSLETFMQRKPIVADAKGKVLAGNGTWRAAKLAGWETIACVKVDDDPTTAKAYALADNRTALESEWDDDLLSASLRYLNMEDESLLAATGFSEEEIDDLLKGGKAGGFDEDDPLGDDQQKAVTCPSCGHSFDLKGTFSMKAS